MAGTPVPGSPVQLAAGRKEKSSGREVAESCFDFLAIEVINYCTRQAEDHDVLLYDLERLGTRIGEKLAEKYLHPSCQLLTLSRLSAERNRFSEKIDIVKWLAKDLWGVLFNKPVDTLKTNHKVLLSSEHSLVLTIKY